MTVAATFRVRYIPLYPHIRRVPMATAPVPFHDHGSLVVKLRPQRPMIMVAARAGIPPGVWEGRWGGVLRRGGHAMAPGARARWREREHGGGDERERGGGGGGERERGGGGANGGDRAPFPVDRPVR